MMIKPLWIAAGIGFVLAAVTLAPAEPRADDPDLGKSFRVPYRLTETNHWLVRAKVNGKGPFNFLVDSGAPVLYIGTEAAKAVGIKPAEDDFWTPIDRFEIEGGAVLHRMKARIEDPFQLVGMNALGLPGASIDGILGYTVLARFRIEMDPTEDRMTWTRLDFEPKEPFIPKFARNKKGPAPSVELQAMQAMGPLMKLMSVFVGRQPEEKREPRGMIGVVLEARDGGTWLAEVLEDSPAAKAGLKPGDRLERIDGQRITDPASAHAAVAKIRPGRSVAMTVRRGEETIMLDMTAGEGL